MGVTASTMSLAVDRLARGGYVRRERDAQDGRRVNLRLTEAGLRVRREKSVLDPELVASLLGRLSAAERREAIRGLELLARAADAEAADRADDWVRRRAAAQRGEA
jgi:DNA-binding MarR family transcriptional regulator